MKKTILILSSIIITGIGFQGCKKGENDPSISMHGRKARICGDWAISAGSSTSTNTSGSTTTTQTQTWTENSLTQTTTSSGSTTSLNGTNAHYTLSIEKDGTWKSDQAATFTAGSVQITSSSVASGTWNWTGGIGDVKKKEQFIMRTLQETDMTTGSPADVMTYTADDAPSTVYELDELKNKEMIIIWDGTTTTTSSGSTTTSSSKGSMTFAQ
jgi:hypothetical protein